MFPHGIEDTEDVIGALSLIIYSLTLIPLLKYVFVVLRANDNGQGGVFALHFCFIFIRVLGIDKGSTANSKMLFQLNTYVC